MNERSGKMTLKISNLIKLTAAAGIAAAAMLASAAIDDSIYFFRSAGPDAYMDGTPVVDGEFYAVVYQKDGVEFAGFNSDCTVADTDNSRLVAAFSVAKDSMCPGVVLEIDSGYEKTLTGGSYGLYLLDTRVSYRGGSYALAPAAENGRPTIVRAYGSVPRQGCDAQPAVCRTAAGAFSLPPIDYSEIAETNVVMLTNTVVNTLTETVYKTETEYVTLTNVVEMTNDVFNVITSTNEIENLVFLTNSVENLVFLTNSVELVITNFVEETVYVTNETERVVYVTNDVDNVVYITNFVNETATTYREVCVPVTNFVEETVYVTNDVFNVVTLTNDFENLVFLTNDVENLVFLTNITDVVVTNAVYETNTVTVVLTNVVDDIRTTRSVVTETVTVTNYVNEALLTKESDIDGEAAPVACGKSMSYSGVLYGAGDSEAGVATWTVSRPGRNGRATVKIRAYSLALGKYVTASASAYCDENGQYDVKVSGRRIEGRIEVRGSKASFVGNVAGEECAAVGSLDAASMLNLLRYGK